MAICIRKGVRYKRHKYKAHFLFNALDCGRCGKRVAAELRPMSRKAIFRK